MTEKYNFKYLPLTGKLPGKSMVEQTETAINELAEVVFERAGDSLTITELTEIANTALNKATQALETSGRTYLTITDVVNVNDYCDSELYYIFTPTSANLPVAEIGFLEVKTNDDKTACEQVFIADSTGTPYYRHGRITKQTVGKKTTYVATWSSWYRVATTEYVQAELQDYLPLSGGTLTGDVDITGDLSVSGETSVPTANAGNSSKTIANTEFVAKSMQEAKDIAQEALDVADGAKTTAEGIAAGLQTQITTLSESIQDVSDSLGEHLNGLKFSVTGEGKLHVELEEAEENNGE